MADTLTGTRLGPYELRALLGSGGMGSVYRGYDPALDREVAIKVIGGAAMLPDALARFRREARLAAALRHPNIVHVYSFGEAGGRLYMVQELLPGPSLADVLRRNRRPMPPARVRALVGQLASALDYAHAQGVVHRDVKPGNALFNAAGSLVLTDFGLARDARLHQAATGAGLVMGTPGYIAPEQAVGSGGVTKGADIYALGVVLFELLTGRLPFVAETPMGVVLKHLYDDPPPPSTLRPDLPPAVDAVVLRAMRKEVSARFPSAGALAAALDAAWPDQARRSVARSRPAASASIAARASTRPAPRKAMRARAIGEHESVPARRNPNTPERRERQPSPAGAVRAPRRATIPDQARPRSTAPAARAPATPAHGGLWPLRVGLLTACIVGILLIVGFGLDQATLTRGWAELLRIVTP